MGRWATETPPPGVPYGGVLRTRHASPALTLVGVALGILSFTVLAPLVMRSLAGLYQVITRAADFADTYAALVAYEIPFGLVVGHLGLATLIPIAAALLLFLHHVRPGYLSSVQGRIRWRWFGVTLGVAAACLAVILLAQNLTAPGGPRWGITPQDSWLAFVAVMLLTTPFQAAAEEYFFRGYLIQAFGSLVANPWFGIITSSAVFTLFHSSTDPALIVDRFAFGILAGMLVVATGGLEAAIAAHVVNNVASFALAALTSSMAEVKAVSEVTWVAAGWDIARFAFFATLVWWVARRVQPQRLTAAH
ncbi:MAG: lysostaphin resistance A-like protein [Propioniciclava sp.]